MSRNTLITLAVVAAMMTGNAHAAGVVWNHGFGSGTTGFDWSDQSDDQNMADSVTFAHATTVSGYNFFSASDLSAQTGSGDFQLKLLSNHFVAADHQNEPDQLLLTENIGFTVQTQACTGCVPGGWNAYELSFSFAPIRFAAGTTYWIGLSGNGFDADVLSVLGVQDDSMAQFEGDRFAFIANGANGDVDVGDQMFQLVGTVPEPADVAMMVAGLALLGVAMRRRHRERARAR